MNDGLADDHPAIRYYDGDYPWRDDPRAPRNFDSVVTLQGLEHDVEFYLSLARGIEGPVLDLCCGTGRIAMPLARAGHRVLAVDLSQGQLAGFAANLDRESLEVRARIESRLADITTIDLGSRFDLAILAFNSLCCLLSAEAQLEALHRIGRHLSARGRVVLDLVNPLRLALQGDAVPKPFFTRMNPVTGRTYTRFAMSDPFDEEHRQRLHGWYDELGPDGQVSRSFYSLHWRPIFLPELRQMLARAGLEITELYGGHRREPFTAQSMKMVVVAGRVSRSETGGLAAEGKGLDGDHRRAG
jgi:SAM-dependent methyltransferase